MREELQSTIESTIVKLFNCKMAVEMSRPAPQFGDYATNIALQLAGQLKKSPQEIAMTLADTLKAQLGHLVADIAVANNFINFRFHDVVLIEGAKRAAHYRSEVYKKQTVVIEYSDPNPFKPLHAGHLYTTLVGDSIARLVETSGAKTIRISYSGDVGLHVARSLWAIINYLGGEYPEKLSDIQPAERVAWLGQRYIEGSTAYEENEQFKQEINEINKLVYQIHTGNDHKSALAEIYWTGRKWSYDYFPKLYQELKVIGFDRTIPESEVTPLGIATVRKQLDKGVYEKSNGAIIFRGEPYGLHTRVFINSQGLPTYEAKDVGLLLTKWKDYKFDHSIIITANEQMQYMQVVLKSVEQFAPQSTQRTTHLTHGIVKLAGGVKMSSRKGNIVGALDILASAEEAAKKLFEKVSQSTILSAVKYAFLKNRIGADIIYDPSESMSITGSSGPYLQYTHARARSILKKAGARHASKNVTLEPAERELALIISRYPEVLDLSVTELMPHHICTFLFEMAQAFSHFYEQNRVIGNTRESLRLQLVQDYANVLKNGLNLLGIEAPDHL